MKIQHLTLKNTWFDMIASGLKTCEYREIKPYWKKRLFYPDGSMIRFDKIIFRNGYSKDSPVMAFRHHGTWSGHGILTWGAPLQVSVYGIELGERTNVLQSDATLTSPTCTNYQGDGSECCTVCGHVKESHVVRLSTWFKRDQNKVEQERKENEL
jgi:hypothetical protein